MGSIALQIERLASGSVAASEAVLFDHVAYLSGDILYDAGSGSITFNAPGRYLFNWSVVIQSISSGNNLIFSLVSSQSDVLQGNALLRSGEVTGAAIIDIAAAPATVSLLNGGAGNAVYGSVPVKANLVVFMDTPAGIADSSYCFSMAQLANVVEQLITLYPTSTMSVFTTNLNTLTGTPYQLFGSVDGENGALFVLENGTQRVAVPLKAITAIYAGDGTVYDQSISYLTPPQPLPAGCDTDLMTAVHDYLPLMTSVSLRMGVSVQASGEIYRNEYGLLVLSDAAGSTPIFVPVFNLAAIITTEAAAGEAAAGAKLLIENKQSLLP